MDSYQVAMNWGIFGAAAMGLGYYYWPQQNNSRSREDLSRRRKSEQDTRSRLGKKSSESDLGNSTTAGNGGNAPARKRKVQPRETTNIQETPTVVVHADEPGDVDMGTRAFAEQMAQTRKGTDLSSGKSKEQRVKTVKQTSALNTPVLSSGSSQGGADADDDLSPAPSPRLNGGGVADMLEPASTGPSTLRLTAPSKPQKERVVKQQKPETVETKKQRQNRQKSEQARMEREENDREYKALQEKQRRTAREARGEPARNGIPVSKPPTNNAWTGSQQVNGSVSAPLTNGTNAPLLDTFDAESNSSSNGGAAMSTAATSTTSNGAPSEEDQLAQAMRQSEDESGWTTVAQPKKQQKKPAAEQPNGATKAPASNVKPRANGKPTGFQALEVEYEQRADADPSDASNWDA